MQAYSLVISMRPVDPELGAAFRRLVVTRGRGLPVSRDYPADTNGRIGTVIAIDGERTILELQEMKLGSTPEVIASSAIEIGRTESDGAIWVVTRHPVQISDEVAKQVRNHLVGSPVALNPNPL